MRRLVIAAFCLTVAACGGRDSERRYPLQGQVLSVAPDRSQATISHDEVKGFMPAMTMPYTVHDPQQFDGIVAGDLIRARLVVQSNDAFLTDVQKIGQAPLPQAPPEAAPAASSGFELLKPGEEVPDASFLDQDGRRRQFHSFIGTAVLLTFIYTNCPLPSFCPMMDRHFATIEKTLQSDATLTGRAHLVTVSFDPIVDTPPVLKAHGTRLGADFKDWTFLTGNRDDIDKFAARFGVSVARAPQDPRDITHNLRTAIIDSQGKLVKIYIGNDWTPDRALADLAPVVRDKVAG
jgi:protein SCO1/2